MQTCETTAGVKSSLAIAGAVAPAMVIYGAVKGALAEYGKGLVRYALSKRGGDMSYRKLKRSKTAQQSGAP